MKEVIKKIFLCGVALGLAFQSNAQTDSAITDSTNFSIPKKSLIKKIVVPAALIGYGSTSLVFSELRRFDRYVNNSTIGPKGYSGSIDDYLRYGPVAAAYGLDLIGVKSKHNFIDRTAMLLMATGLTSVSVTLTKRGVARQRPDASSFTSFPSSHTAMAFMSAEFLYQEYKEHTVWISIAGYAAATTTGVLRLYHHVHWFSDVIMGAGYGILATKISYLVYPYLKNIFVPKAKYEMVIIPSFQPKNFGLSITYRLH